MSLQSVVQEECHRAGNEHFAGEYNIDDVVELEEKEERKMRFYEEDVKYAILKLITHRPDVWTGP